MTFSDRLAALKKRPRPTHPTDVVLGDLVRIELTRLRGREWVGLIDDHPPAVQEHRPVGYNRTTLTEAYPLDSITTDGDTPDAPTWRDVLGTLGAQDRRNVIAAV